MPVRANCVAEEWPTLWASMPLTIAEYPPHRWKKRLISGRSSPEVKLRLPSDSVRVSGSMSTLAEPWCGSKTVVVSHPPPAKKKMNLRSPAAAWAIFGFQPTAPRAARAPELASRLRREKDIGNLLVGQDAGIAQDSADH